MIKKTVGLIVLTNTGKAVLQMRGDFNIEKNQPETYKGATQLTAHGSVKEGESEKDALLRETKEELGGKFVNIIQGLPLEEINKIENENIIVTNFGTIVSERALKKIEINPSTGGSIRLISKSDVDNIHELKAEDRESGVLNDEIAMFPDDIEAVKLAFEKFS